MNAVELVRQHWEEHAAVLAAAGEIPEVKAVATIGAPSAPAHVGHLLATGREEIERLGEAVVDLAGRKFTIKRQFLADIEGQIVVLESADGVTWSENRPRKPPPRLPPAWLHLVQGGGTVVVNGPTLVLAGSETAGVWVSTDDGDTWTQEPTLPGSSATPLSS